MALERFSGFSSRVRYTSLPNSFFSTVLPHMDDIGELKVMLHIFWLTGTQKGYPRFVTESALRQDTILQESLGSSCPQKADILRQSLRAAVGHHLLLRLELVTDTIEDTAYFLNTESNSALVARIHAGTYSLGTSKPRLAPSEHQIERRDIYSLYEQNVGMLTPLIAEELKEAEERYPVAWIEDAFREAVRLNRRTWKYIVRILERWAMEGKDDGEPGRDTQKTGSQNKYLRGKYGHVVRR